MTLTERMRLMQEELARARTTPKKKKETSNETADGNGLTGVGKTERDSSASPPSPIELEIVHVGSEQSESVETDDDGESAYEREQRELAELRARAGELGHTVVPISYGSGSHGPELLTIGGSPAAAAAKQEKKQRYAYTEEDLAQERAEQEETFREFKEGLEKEFAHLRKKLKHPKDAQEVQWDAVARAVYAYGVLRENRQVIAPTGQGKTYFTACFLRIMSEMYPTEWNPLHAAPRTPPIIIEPPKAVAQTQLVLADWGVLAIVTSLASFRFALGEICLDWRTVMVNQQPQLYPFIKMEHAPICVVVDESQQVKNEDSVQSTIIESFAGHGVPVLPMSATPYSRVCQAKIIACILKPEFKFGASMQKLTPKLWPQFADMVCAKGARPDEWSPASLRNLRNFLEPYTIRWSIQYPQKVYTKYVACRFATAAERARYMDLDNEWQRIRASKGKDPLTDQIRLLVAIQKFNQGAEEIRAPHLARAAYALWREHETNPRKKKISIILGFAYATALEIAQRELEKLGAGKLAIIRGGRNCETDHDAFQADKRPLLLLTIACGGAGLNLDNNKFNKRQRYMFCSAVWNDIQMAQLAGRTQRMDTQTPSWMYIMYYEGTEELSKLRKMHGKVQCLKEVTTKAASAPDKNGRGGSFVEDIDNIDTHRAGVLAELPAGEEEEEMIANEIVGTKSQIEVEVVE